MNKDKIIKAVDSLSDNTMFNMSLTSKELFHSNIWAWMIKKYPNIFAPAFNLSYDKNEIFEIYREKHHFDLSIQTKDEFIIIENKLKSFPDKKQLERYAKYSTHLKKKIVLISYLSPLFNWALSPSNPNDGIEWRFSHYGELHRVLKKCFDCAKASDFKNNDMALVQEYIEFLELLNQLQDCVKFDDNDKIGDLWAIIKDSEVQNKLNKINFSKTIERILTSKLTEKVLTGFDFLNNIDEIRIDCGRDLKIFSDILFYFPGAWDKDENKKQDLFYLGVSLWENEYRYYSGLNKKQCRINLPKQSRYDKKNKNLGYEYLKNNYGWFFNREQDGKWGGYSYDNAMYLYKKTDISNYTVAKLSEKVQFDLGLIYAYVEDLKNGGLILICQD